jgi:hypothetical protein
MNSTTTDFKAIPIAADQDARNLAIVYGSLGTLIAFTSLVFAILSWMRSRHHRLAAHQPSDDVELGVNTLRDTVRVRQELHSPGSVSHKYVPIKKYDRRSKLTSHSDHCQATSAFSAITTTQPQSPFELEGDATMPSRTHESPNATGSTNTMDPPCSVPVAPQTP